MLESGLQQGEVSLPVLLLGYEQGFQIWLLKDCVKEIASRRDNHVRQGHSKPTPGSDTLPLLCTSKYPAKPKLSKNP